MILVDDRGQQEVAATLVTELAGLGIEAEIADPCLRSADIAWLAGDGHTVGVERKTLSDLAHSLMGDRLGDTSRLEGQLTNMLEDYDERVLLLDDTIGEVDGFLATLKRIKTKESKYIWIPVWVSRFTPQRLAAVMWSVQKNGIDFVFTNGYLAPTVYAMYAYTQRPDDKHKFMRHYLRPAPPTYSLDPQVASLMAVWKGLPEAVATKLIGIYRTTWRVLHTSREGLMQVEGIGGGRVDKLYKYIGKEQPDSEKETQPTAKRRVRRAKPG